MLENVVASAFWTPQHIVGVITTILIALVLAHASIEDLLRRDIGSIHVVVLYILVAMFSVITGNMSMETTYVFLFAFLLFMGISIFSKGHFGIGDSLVIGALAWYFGSFSGFQNFLYGMGMIAIPWAVYWTIRYRKDNTLNGMIHGFRKTVSIDKVNVGDVLSTDNFMHGLTRPQIDKYRQDGFITLEIKKVLPFIPVIFMSFLLNALF